MATANGTGGDAGSNSAAAGTAAAAGAGSSGSGKEAVPADAQRMARVLASMGVEKHEPRVVLQMLEFCHRYITEVLQDALVYSEHSGKNDLDLEDVRLAIQSRVNTSFTQPPPREFLIDLAAQRNAVPLPVLPVKYGIRLPEDRWCLTEETFQVQTKADEAAAAQARAEQPPPPGPAASGTTGGADVAPEPMDVEPTQGTSSALLGDDGTAAAAAAVAGGGGGAAAAAATATSSAAAGEASTTPAATTSTQAAAPPQGNGV